MDSQVAPAIDQERAAAGEAIHQRYADLLAHLTDLPKEQRAAARQRLMHERANDLARMTRDLRGKADEVRRRATAELRQCYARLRGALLTRQRHERASFSVALPARRTPRAGRIAIPRAQATAAVARARRRRHARAPRSPTEA